MEVPAAVWGVAEPVSQVGHLGIVLYGISGTYLGTLMCHCSGDSKRPAHDRITIFIA